MSISLRAQIRGETEGADVPHRPQSISLPSDVSHNEFEMFHVRRHPYSILHSQALQDSRVNDEASVLPTDSLAACAIENSAWSLGGGNPAIWFPVLHNLGQTSWLRELDSTGSRKGREVRLRMEGEHHQFPCTVTLCSPSFPVLLIRHSGWSLASC